MRGRASALAVIALALAGCTPVEGAMSARPRATEPLALPSAPPSALVLVLDPAHLAPSLRAAGALVAATARAHQRVVVLCGRRTVLASTAPASTARLPGPPSPAPLPSHATDYQRSQYEAQRAAYDKAVASGLESLRAQQRREVASWADSVRADLAPGASRAACPGGTSFALALDEAGATLASLEQAGTPLQARKVIVAFGEELPAGAPRDLSESLQGATVVVSGFRGGSADQAGWQTRLVEAGAGRAVVLTAGAALDIAPVVSRALDGAVAESLRAEVLFPAGKATLPASGEAALARVARLLATNRGATAVVNGYADTVPAPEGNDVLSRRRAQAVKDWLVHHGIAERRLSTVGHGERFPVGPNGAQGQPANRRAVIVINPGS